MDSNVLTDTPIVGLPSRAYGETYVAGTEPLVEGEMRVTVIGSGDPWPRKSQASGSVVVEVGNPELDFFFFDLGSSGISLDSSEASPRSVGWTRSRYGAAVLTSLNWAWRHSWTI
jgi:hypothetical protein